MNAKLAKKIAISDIANDKPKGTTLFSGTNINAKHISLKPERFKKEILTKPIIIQIP